MGGVDDPHAAAAVGAGRCQWGGGQMSSFAISPVCASLRAMRPPDGCPGDWTGGVQVSCGPSVPRRCAVLVDRATPGVRGTTKGTRRDPWGGDRAGGDCRTGGMLEPETTNTQRARGRLAEDRSQTL